MNKWLWISCALVLSVSASAQTIDLAQASAAAWQRILVVRQAQAQLQLTQLKQQNINRPGGQMPALELGQRMGSSRETELGFTLPLWLPGQQQANVTLAQTDTQLAELTLLQTQLQVVGEVREAGWQILLAQAELAQWDGQLAQMKQLAQDVARRVAAGDLARTDELLAQAEVLAVSSAQREAQQRWQAAVLSWKNLTGLAELPDENSLRETVREGEHPVLQQAKAQRLYAEAQLALQQHSLRDSPELKLAARKDGADKDILLGVRLPLSDNKRNHIMLQQHETALANAQWYEQRLREQLDSESQIARQALASAELQLSDTQQRLTWLRERETLLQRAFQLGNIALSELLRAVALTAEAERDQVRQQRVIGLKRARLQQALGVMP